MKSLNKVFLLGHLGLQPSLLTTKDGKPFTRLSLATHHAWKGDNQERHETTDWHQITVWGAQAERCVEYLSVGALVFIEGYLSSYKVDKDDQNQERRVAITAHRVNFLARPAPQTATNSAS